MTEKRPSSSPSPSPEDRPPVPFEVDTRVPRPARLYNYLAGGSENFTVDRETAERVAAGIPGGLDTIRAAVRSVGDFTNRVVRYLVDETGIRQLLYIGTPVPAGRQVHEVAQQAAPDTRVVYVGNDPVVLAHAHILKRSTPEGATAYIHGTLRAPEEIWAQATRTLDPSRPVAILVPVTLCLVPNRADPHGLVARLLDAVPPGSYLMVAHTSGDIPTEGQGGGDGGGDRDGDGKAGATAAPATTASQRLDEALPEQYVFRTPAEITRFFHGLDLVDPGLVPIYDWRPSPDTVAPAQPFPMHGALARRP